MKYVDDADLATNKIRVVPKGERETDPGAGSGPDAEDLMVLRRKVVLSSPKNAVGGRTSRNIGTKVIIFKFCLIGLCQQYKKMKIERRDESQIYSPLSKNLCRLSTSS